MCRILSRELVKQSMNPKNYFEIQTHRNGPKIPFLMCADDYIIFAKASPKACININKVLQDFCALSGQLVNLHKSSVQISNNLQGAMKRRLGEVLNIYISNSISKYLGCPIIQGRVKSSTFSEVVLSS